MPTRLPVGVFAGEEPFYYPPPRRVPRPPFPRKSAAVAFFLLFIGLVFGFTGLGLFLSKGLTEAGPFLILGGIGMFISLASCAISTRFTIRVA